MFYWWDPTYILVVIAALISMAASARVNRTYSRYARPKHVRMTGAEAARRILQYQGDL